MPGRGGRTVIVVLLHRWLHSYAQPARTAIASFLIPFFDLVPEAFKWMLAIVIISPRGSLIFVHPSLALSFPAGPFLE